VQATDKTESFVHELFRKNDEGKSWGFEDLEKAWRVDRKQHKSISNCTDDLLQKQTEEHTEVSPELRAKTGKHAGNKALCSLFKESFGRRPDHLSVKVVHERHLEAADVSYIDRLLNYKQSSEEQFLRRRHQAKELEDPEQACSRPADRAPFGLKSQNQLVYPCASLEAKDRTHSENTPPSPLLAIPQSEILLLKVKDARYHELFEQLNPNARGHIAAKTIVPEAVDTEALQIMKPVLDELAELDETLNFSEFSEAMDNLTGVITHADKARLFKLNKQTVFLPKSAVSRQPLMKRQ
jgi:hypothetical protein